MNEVDVLTVFVEEGYQISSEAVELICSHCSPKELVAYILENIDLSVLVIDVDHIDLEGFSDMPSEGEESFKSSSELSSQNEVFKNAYDPSYQILSSSTDASSNVCYLIILYLSFQTSLTIPPALGNTWNLSSFSGIVTAG
ncbi:hypothetical protein V7O67_01710 [Methanolobus sp. ZRKC4]